MVNVPSQPEIITVNSEELQTAVRDLLPSQNGFGSELQASNVIFPVIDLTPTAEGSSLPISLQTALSFGSNTDFAASSSTVSLVASAGFYRVVGVSSIEQGSTAKENAFSISDGITSKDIWLHRVTGSASADSFASVPFDLVFWLRPGDTLSATAAASANLIGSHRQIATGDGTLVQPSGYPL